MPLSWVSKWAACVDLDPPEEGVFIGEILYMPKSWYDIEKQNGKLKSQYRDLKLRLYTPAELILWDLAAVLKHGFISRVWCNH